MAKLETSESKRLRFVVEASAIGAGLSSSLILKHDRKPDEEAVSYAVGCGPRLGCRQATREVNVVDDVSLVTLTFENGARSPILPLTPRGWIICAGHGLRHVHATHGLFFGHQPKQQRWREIAVGVEGME